MKIVFDEITTKNDHIIVEWGGAFGTAKISDFETAKTTGVDIPKEVNDLGAIKIAGMEKLVFDEEQNQAKKEEAAQWEADKAEAEKVAAIKDSVGGRSYTDETNSTYKFAEAPKVETCDMKWSGGTTTFSLVITSKNVTMTYKSGTEYPYAEPMTYNFADDMPTNPVITLTRAEVSESPYYPERIVLRQSDAQ